MLSPGDRVVVAVSGGPDSVCLLRALLAFMPKYKLTLHVAHLDHRFRGEESAAEARFVRGLAARLSLPATIEASDVPAYCRERGLSAQAGAREVRYAFLQEVAKREHAARIALGHTANDQAETLLMRLIRGAGVTGLSAIPPFRENIIRPIIDVTREEVLAYLKEHGQDFVTDPSNLKPLYTRNRVRKEVLPVLERFNPRIVEALATAAAVLRDEDAAMEDADADVGKLRVRPARGPRHHPSGTVTRFDHPRGPKGELKVPHVCWNRLNREDRSPARWEDTLLNGLPDGSYMYFVHSYHVVPEDDGVVVATTGYGHIEFCSVLQHKNIFACQCHPERSGEVGLQVYENLAKRLN